MTSAHSRRADFDFGPRPLRAGPASGGAPRRSAFRSFGDLESVRFMAQRTTWRSRPSRGAPRSGSHDQ